MTIPTHAAQDLLDQADRDLRTARTAFDTAAVAFDRVRTGPPSDTYQQARAAWVIAGHTWLTALIARTDAEHRQRCLRHDWTQP